MRQLEKCCACDREMQTGKAGGTPRAAQDLDIDALLDDDLADIDELLASMALQPPCTPERSAPQPSANALRIHGDAPAFLPSSPSAPALTPPAAAVATPPPSLPCADAELVCDAPPAASTGASGHLLASAPHWPLCSYSAYGSPPPPNYTTTLDPASPPVPPDFGAVLDCTGEEEQAKEVELQRQQPPRRLDYSTHPISPSENRPRGGDELADDPSPADLRLGVETAEEVVLEQGIDLRFSPEEVWAASVALTIAEGEDPQCRWRKAEQERADEARNALEVERMLRRMKAMTESAKRGCPVNIY